CRPAKTSKTPCHTGGVHISTAGKSRAAGPPPQEPGQRLPQPRPALYRQSAQPSARTSNHRKDPRKSSSQIREDQRKNPPAPHGLGGFFLQARNASFRRSGHQ